MNAFYVKVFFTLVSLLLTSYTETRNYKGIPCLQLLGCVHNKRRKCGIDRSTNEVRWFLDKCDIFEFNCEYKTSFERTRNFRCKDVPPI